MWIKEAFVFFIKQKATECHSTVIPIEDSAWYSSVFMQSSYNAIMACCKTLYKTKSNTCNSKTDLAFIVSTNKTYFTVSLDNSYTCSSDHFRPWPSKSLSMLRIRSEWKILIHLVTAHDNGWLVSMATNSCYDSYSFVLGHGNFYCCLLRHSCMCTWLYICSSL